MTSSKAEISSLPPSYFAKRGQPMRSKWAKSEMEWIALAYVRALANDGDTWKRLTREQTCALLTDDQERDSMGILRHESQQHRFDAVADQLIDAEGAFGVRGFWSKEPLPPVRTA